MLLWKPRMLEQEEHEFISGQDYWFECSTRGVLDWIWAQSRGGCYITSWLSRLKTELPLPMLNDIKMPEVFWSTEGKGIHRYREKDSNIRVDSACWNSSLHSHSLLIVGALVNFYFHISNFYILDEAFLVNFKFIFKFKKSDFH